MKEYIKLRSNELINKTCTNGFELSIYIEHLFKNNGINIKDTIEKLANASSIIDVVIHLNPSDKEDPTNVDVRYVLKPIDVTSSLNIPLIISSGNKYIISVI